MVCKYQCDFQTGRNDAFRPGFLFSFNMLMCLCLFERQKNELQTVKGGAPLAVTPQMPGRQHGAGLSIDGSQAGEPSPPSQLEQEAEISSGSQDLCNLAPGFHESLCVKFVLLLQRQQNPFSLARGVFSIFLK